MTYLELVNEVLKALREDTVSTVDETNYSTFIASLVNRAKEEVEAAWKWSALCSSISVVTNGDGTTYTGTLTGTTERTEIINVYDSTNNCYVKPTSFANITKWRNENSTALTGNVGYFCEYGTSSDLKQIAFYPIPTVATTLSCYVYNPQATLSTGSTSLTVPSIPVWKLAYAYAVSERGEDGGAIYDEVNVAAESALNDAILRDAKYRQDELIWTVV